MKSFIVNIVLAIIFFLWLAGTEIELSPFSVRLPDWKTAVGMILIIIGIAILIIHYHDSGVDSGIVIGKKLQE